MRIAVSIAAVILSLPAAAQAPRLGTIDFPTSASGDAQAAFVEGVLFLHSFEFTSAGAAFRRAQAADPGFAMAYWGEAMTYNHPLWGEWDDVAARAVLGRLGATPEARRARAPTHREQMYLAAVEALWADGPKPVRDTAYAEAMERLVQTRSPNLACPVRRGWWRATCGERRSRRRCSPGSRTTPGPRTTSSIRSTIRRTRRSACPRRAPTRASRRMPRTPST